MSVNQSSLLAYSNEDMSFSWQKKQQERRRDEHFSSSTYLYIHLLSFSSILSRCCFIFPRRSSSSIFFCMPEIESSGKT